MDEYDAFNAKLKSIITQNPSLMYSDYPYLTEKEYTFPAQSHKRERYPFSVAKWSLGENNITSHDLMQKFNEAQKYNQSADGLNGFIQSNPFLPEEVSSRFKLPSIETGTRTFGKDRSPYVGAKWHGDGYGIEGEYYRSPNKGSTLRTSLGMAFGDGGLNLNFQREGKRNRTFGVSFEMPIENLFGQSLGAEPLPDPMSIPSEPFQTESTQNPLPSQQPLPMGHALPDKVQDIFR